ncbi:MAG TPA: hypothetical protein VF057_06735, partial [Thermoanaerobaculia bacterium]
MRPIGWVVFVGVLSLAATASNPRFAPSPALPPAQAKAEVEPATVRLEISVDDSVAREHGPRLREYLEEVVALHNIEWRTVRHEWFEIAGVTVEPRSEHRDAMYLLADLVNRTVQERDILHVRIAGHALELYSSGTAARQIGGLAFRGSDAVIVSAVKDTPADLLAYYLFHELGHCWDAFDLPFGGGNSTFGSKQFATFSVDAGNAQIMEDSSGPRPRDTPLLAPAVIRAKLATARKVVRDPDLFRAVHDLLLHEPSPANRTYVAKRNKVLARAGKERRAVARLIARYEITPREAAEEAEARRELSGLYWVANDAIKR